jgi:hypothetical protein
MENKVIKVISNCPVPRGGSFIETRYYANGQTKTICRKNFHGRFTGWDAWADSSEVPYDKIAKPLPKNN